MLCVLAAPHLVREYIRGIRMRRLKAVVDRTHGLVGALEHLSGVDRLAALYELQNRYNEADEYLDKIDDKELVAAIQTVRQNIKAQYDRSSDRIGLTGDNAADFARAMETLGRKLDGGKFTLGR